MKEQQDGHSRNTVMFKGFKTEDKYEDLRLEDKDKEKDL